MSISTTEITSTSIKSDNPLHQRLLFAYVASLPYVNGDLLEVGCGEGRGIELLIEKCNSITAIDRNEYTINHLKEKFKEITFIKESVPPFNGVESDRFDSLITFQVIEHIEDDELFVKEIARVLKPGGVGLITTPNIKMSLTRNPWHIREYTKEELENLLKKYFSEVEMLGVYGDDKVNQYYEQNKESVKKFTRFDIFNLQYKLPRSVLRIPYDILNRMNRNKLQEQNDDLVMQISTDDYSLKPADDRCFDFFCVIKK